MLPTHFLTDNHPLRGEDAVAAIITVEDGRYLMQLRDDIPGIFYPGHWGCFGGAVGLVRTVWMPSSASSPRSSKCRRRAPDEFVTFDFDLSKLGQKKCYRTYYEIKDD